MPVTTWWCELAWLGGEAPASGVVVKAERRGHHRAQDRGHPRAGRGATADAAWCFRVSRTCHSHAFHRALRGRSFSPPTARSGRGATGCTPSPSGSTPTACCRWRGRPTPRWRSPGSPASGSSTTCTTRGREAVRRPRTRWARRSLTAAEEAGHPADPARHLLSRPQVSASRSRACKIGSPTAPPTPGPSGSPPSARQSTFAFGAAVHSVRAVPADAAAAVAEWAEGRDRPRCTCTCPSSRRRTPPARAPTASPRRPGSPSEASSAQGRRPCTRRTSPTATSTSSRPGTGICLCPTTERDLADGIGAFGRMHAAAVPLSVGSDSQAVIDLLEETRLVEQHERLRTGTRGHWSAAELLTIATANGHRRSAGRRPGGSRSGQLRTSSPWTSPRCGRSAGSTARA